MRGVRPNSKISKSSGPRTARREILADAPAAEPLHGVQCDQTLTTRRKLTPRQAKAK